MSDNHLTLAKRFWVDDMPGSSVSGSRLSNLLETFARGNSLSVLGQRFLTENGLKMQISVNVTERFANT